jgi:hypothetical protein
MAILAIDDHGRKAVRHARWPVLEKPYINGRLLAASSLRYRAPQMVLHRARQPQSDEPGDEVRYIAFGGGLSVASGGPPD